MARKELVICDICGKETNNEKKDFGMIFTTEQTEGRGVKPYFTRLKIDVCDVCLEKLKDWNVQIVGSGAMGGNEYKLVRMELKKVV